MPVFDRERAALILIDAIVIGDKLAAEKHQVSDRTIRNHRERLETDASFAAFFRRLQTQKEKDWQVVRLRFLRSGIAKLQQLVELANSPKDIKNVAEAVKTVGELQIVSDALDGSDGTDIQGEADAEAEVFGPRSGEDGPATVQ